MLIDSDVLVWLTRGHAGAAKRLHAPATWKISAVTYVELAQGCRDNGRSSAAEAGARGVEHRERSGHAGHLAAPAALIDELALSHGLRLADALIGATAMAFHETLLTGNIKDFAAIEGLQVEGFVP